MTNDSRRLACTYSAGMDTFMRRTLDWFAGAAAVAAVIGAVREAQFGPTYYVMVFFLATFCVLPAFALRADRYLRLRGNLIVVGFMAAMFIGIIQLGLNAVALIGIPLFLGVSAAISGRLVPYVGLALAMAGLSCIGYLHTSGHIAPIDPTLGTWSTSPKNWTIAIICNLIVSALMIGIIQMLRACWKESNAEAINSYNQLAALIEAAPDAIMIYNLETDRYVTANARAEDMFGYARDIICNDLSIEDLLPPQQPGGADMRAMMAKTPKDKCCAFEARFLKADGTELSCEVSLSRLPSIGDNLIRASLIDLTDRKAAQKRQAELQSQLEASLRLEAIGKLTGGVAHDFNNLLAVIIGNLELLKEMNAAHHDEELIEASITAALHGSDLTRSMLTFARKAPLQAKIVDLNGMTRATRNWAGRTLPSNIEIVTSLATNLWQTKTDEAALESAVLNLVLNAHDAMPDGGRLKISTMNLALAYDLKDDLGQTLRPGKYAAVEVSDTGHGIPKDTLGKIFEPFFTTKAVNKGSGLGLAMVHGFMGQSGGVVHVFTGPSKGTTVRLCFPAVENVTVANFERAEDPAQSPKPAHRILLVEDDQDVAKVVAAILGNANYRVHVETSGDAAKTAFVDDPTFDLLLTDLAMPGRLQGFDLAEELRAINPQLPVIVMSGHSDTPTGDIESKYQDLRLVKPVRSKDLIATISRALAADRDDTAPSPQNVSHLQLA